MVDIKSQGMGAGEVVSSETPCRLEPMVGSGDTWADVYSDRYGEVVGEDVYLVDSSAVEIEGRNELGEWVLLEAERLGYLPGYWAGRAKTHLEILGLVVRDRWRDAPKVFKLSVRSWLWNGGAAVCLASAIVSCGISMKLDRAGWTWLLVGSTAAVMGVPAGRELHKEVIERRWLEELDEKVARVRREEELGIRPINPNTLAWSDDQAKLIMCLMRYGMSVMILSAYEGLSLQRYLVVPVGTGAAGGRLYQDAIVPGLHEIQERANEIKMALKAPMRPDIHPVSDGIAIDVPLPAEKRRPALFSEYVLGAEKPIGGIQVPMGVDFDKRLVLWNITLPSTPHCLTSGTTGSGKSMRVKTGLLALALWYTRQEIEVTIYDPKRDFDPVLVAKTPIVVKHLTDINDIRTDLRRKVAEREARQRVLGSYSNIADMNSALTGENEKFRLPYIYIVVDELPELCQDEVIKAYLSNLARLGRTAGIVLDTNAQRPAADVIDVQLRSNLPVRWVGKLASTYDSYIATGNEEDPRGFYLMGNGDCMYYDKSDNGRRIQGLLVRDSEVGSLPIEWNKIDESQFYGKTLAALRGSYDMQTGRVMLPIEEGEDVRRDENGFYIPEGMLVPAGSREASSSSSSVGSDRGAIDSTDSAIEKANRLRDLYIVWRERQSSLRHQDKDPESMTTFCGGGGSGFAAKKAELQYAIDLHLEEWIRSENLLQLSDEDILKYVYGLKKIVAGDKRNHLKNIQKISQLREKIMKDMKEERAAADERLSQLTGRAVVTEAPIEEEEVDSVTVAETEVIELELPESDPFDEAMSELDSFMADLESDLYE